MNEINILHSLSSKEGRNNKSTEKPAQHKGNRKPRAWEQNREVNFLFYWEDGKEFLEDSVRHAPEVYISRKVFIKLLRLNTDVVKKKAKRHGVAILHKKESLIPLKWGLKNFGKWQEQ